jgi:general secretion pathway protein I
MAVIWCEARRKGFTLVEVLVALAIISIALLAALRVAGGGTNSVGELRSRLLGSWVAENILAEQRARGDWPTTGILTGQQRQGGIDFLWRQEIISTPNTAFRRVDTRVYVLPDETHAVAKLTGFLVRPPGVAN